MPKTILCLLLASSWCAIQAASASASPASRLLTLENSTMPLPTDKATLIIGPLTRTNGLFVGDFKVKIFPYYFKNDWGRLAINVSDHDLAAMNQGKTVAVTGISTSNKNGTVRHIEIRATPQDRDHGTVCLWFMVGDRKMIFTAAYHFADNPKAMAVAPPPPGKSSLR